VAKRDSRKGKVAPQEHWKDEPDAHDGPAAAEYLSLLLDGSTTATLVEKFKDAPIVRRKAKDLLRASRPAPGKS